MKVTRRSLLRGSLLVGAGAVAGAAATQVPRWVGPDRLPLDGGYAAAADRLGDVRHPGTSVTYFVQTSEPVVAFTFDDGPGPLWTKLVLDTLDHYQVPATFFMVGRNLDLHRDLVRGRLDRHEVGNHSWSHADLARLDLNGVRREISRSHEMIHAVTGREAHLIRPPYGHLGGSTLLAADSLGYNVVLWSQQMHEAAYVSNEQGQVSDIVRHATPGSIILAHDVGNNTRLVALRHLGEMITGLRARGFRFVTVSELMALGTPAVAPAHV
ncbi:polysaccharide deacetylase family protein [Planosporangium thailandense]|uniref:Polysaccharide deacetylase family protein n=1 Tax=Planosporangium thailandense TaxID=765197 RepID=A0ABX0Y5Y5_9ACTN|nr:polysaccharide deacetylase family protein [Planosporangium thailandense]NJC72709.1 polysaccharide deacetylase family protein [Planosporangium thailandense]